MYLSNITHPSAPYMLTAILFISWRTIEDQKINLSSILKIAVNMEVTHPETGYAGYQRPDRPVLKIEYAVLSRGIFSKPQFIDAVKAALA